MCVNTLATHITGLMTLNVITKVHLTRYYVLVIEFRENHFWPGLRHEPHCSEKRFPSRLGIGLHSPTLSHNAFDQQYWMETFSLYQPFLSGDFVAYNRSRFRSNDDICESDHHRIGRGVVADVRRLNTRPVAVLLSIVLSSSESTQLHATTTLYVRPSVRRSVTNDLRMSHCTPTAVSRRVLLQPTNA